MQPEPNPLAILGLCVGGAAMLIFLLWLNHRLRVPSKRAATEARRAGMIEVALSYLLGGAGPVSVNNNPDGGVDVMSRPSDSAPQNTASSLQTRPQTTSDQTEDPKARREKLLDTYRALRKHGISRDDARALLKMWGIPLDNNLWTEAATPAPDEPANVTPIAGRSTSAPFRETDPALEYKPLW